MKAAAQFDIHDSLIHHHSAFQYPIAPRPVVLNAMEMSAGSTNGSWGQASAGGGGLCPPVTHYPGNGNSLHSGSSGFGAANSTLASHLLSLTPVESMNSCLHNDRNIFVCASSDFR